MTRSKNQGYVLLMALVVSSIIMIVTAGFLNYFTTSIRAQRFSLASTQALALAEAGIDKAIYELNQNVNYSGESDTVVGTGAFSVSVSSTDANTKQLTVTANVPADNPTATRTIKAAVSIDTSIVAFRYGVQIGQGGITMNNGSVIEGNVYANGTISGSGTITGDATVAVGAAAVSDQAWSVQDGGFALGDASARANVSQSFMPSASATLTQLKLNLKKTGSPGDITVKVVTDNNGKPSKTVLASGTIPASLVTTSYGFADITLDTTPALTANTTYWVIAIAAVSSSNYFTWGLDSAAGYTRGAAKHSSNWNASNPSWSNITGDLNFEIYLSGLSTEINGVTVGGDAWADKLVNCSIAGDAKYLTSSSCSVGGSTSSSVIPATPIPFAISDAQIAAWEVIAEAGGTLAGPYTITDVETIGPKKITGDLIVDIGGTLILSGPVWVEGDVIFSNNSTLSVSPSTGNSGAIIIADDPNNTSTKGVVDLSNNTTITGNGGENSFPMAISTNTGTDSMILSNNADSVILYAPYGTIQVSNNANANQVTARFLNLLNNATISYVSGLQNASFSNGPGGSWAVIAGTYVITQ